MSKVKIGYEWLAENENDLTTAVNLDRKIQNPVTIRANQLDYDHIYATIVKKPQETLTLKYRARVPNQTLTVVLFAAASLRESGE